MVASNSVRIGSAAVAIWSDSQSRGVPAMAAHIAAARPSSSSSMGSVMDRPARSVVGAGEAALAACVRHGCRGEVASLRGEGMPMALEVLRVCGDPDVEVGLGWGSLLALSLGVCVPGLMV